MTQIEFVEMCARELACDGIVLDVAHFPRIDGDYLAQIKKMAADLGLDIAAVLDDAFFSADEAAMRSSIDLTLALGSPLLAGPLGGEAAGPWSSQRERLARATSLAKIANVTLALRNAPGTFAATTADLKRVAKEADSAWLRFGVAPAQFDAASDARAVVDNIVLLWSHANALPDTVRNAFPEFRGYLALDDASGAAQAAEMKTRLQAWRVS